MAPRWNERQALLWLSSPANGCGCGSGELALDEIVSFTALLNRRSRAVMERIGMTDAGADFEHPAVPEGHPLRPHCLYRIRRL